jgi:hypothetical protein
VLSYEQNHLLIDTKDTAVDAACTDMLRSAVKQQRHRLKKRYFDGVPANEIRTTSPVPSMSDEQWRALVAKWLDPKHMVNICCQIFFFQNQFTNFLILSHWSHAGNMWKEQAESQSSEVPSGYGLSQLCGTLASFCKWTIYYTSTYSFALNNLFIWSDTTLVCLITY